jgi:hypothetical protein
MTRPPRGRRAHRLRRPTPLALALVVASVAGIALAPSAAGRVGVTDAAWVDREHVRGRVTAAASWCQQGLYRTEGRGQLVAGRLTGRDLATLAEVRPLHVQNAGAAPTATPGGAVALGDDAFANPLTATALQALTVDLGSSLLSVPLSAGQGAGALNQYARATTSSVSAGASGAVSDSGAVDVRTQQPGSGLPDVAQVDLRALTGSLLGSGISTAVANDVADLSVRVGAVAASAVLDACTSHSAPAATRAYGVAGLRLDATSRAVAALSTTATTAVGVVQTGIGTTGSLATSLGTSVRGALGLVGALTAVVGLGTPSATLSVNANLPAAVAAVSTTLGAGTAVQVDLATGAARIDLARLTSATDGVNNRPPNSEILTTGTLTTTTTQVAGLLDTWSKQVTQAATDALNTAATTLTVDIPLSTALGTITTLRITVTGSFAVLAAGTGAVKAELVGGCTGLAAAVCGTVSTLLPTLLAPVGAAVATTLTGVFAPTGLVGTLGGTLATAVAGVTGSSGILRALFAGLPSLVSVQVNARPDVATGLRPGLTTRPGEYAVSALRVGLADPAQGAWIALGSATAGPNVYAPPT